MGIQYSWIQYSWIQYSWILMNTQNIYSCQQNFGQNTMFRSWMRYFTYSCLLPGMFYTVFVSKTNYFEPIINYFGKFNGKFSANSAVQKVFRKYSKYSWILFKKQGSYSLFMNTSIRNEITVFSIHEYYLKSKVRIHYSWILVFMNTEITVFSIHDHAWFKKQGSYSLVHEY